MEISLAKPQDNRAKENKKRREQERFRGGPPGRGYVRYTCVYVIQITMWLGNAVMKNGRDAM